MEKRISVPDTAPSPDLLLDLIDDGDLSDYLYQDTPSSKELFEGVGLLCHNAFSNGSRPARHQVNRILYKKYCTFFNLPLDFVALRNLDHPVISAAIALVEKTWGGYEENRARLLLDTNHPNSNLKERILELVRRHKASKHPLFDQLAVEASRSTFLSFFAFDYTLNMRFFDLVAIALPGLTGDAKQEVVQNIWDESGRGNQENAHTVMYERITSVILDNFDPKDLLAQMDFEALAGINLFGYLGLNRLNFYRYLGCLAATEILDPPQYDKLLAGARRIGLDKEVDLTYYAEHATIDIAHAAGWLDRVMTPLADGREEIATEMLIGVQMRLNTCSDYYDLLLDRLSP